MNIRYYNKTDYDTFVEMWKHHDHDIIPIDMLSPIGFVAVDGDSVIGGSWIYIADGCDMAQVAWTSLSPHATIKQKHKALSGIHNMIMSTCEVLGKKNIVMFSDKHGLSKFFHKRGFDMYSDHTLLRRGL